MGDLSVKAIQSLAARHSFLRHLLDDVEAMDQMIQKGMFESAPIRIGAEQELCVVEPDFRPSKSGPEILARSKDPHLTSEIGRFNLEINLDPTEFNGGSLGRMFAQLEDQLAATQRLADQFHQKILLTGILPTLAYEHLQPEYRWPEARYSLLDDVMRELRGRQFDIYLQGADDLIAQLDSVLFEACNTSFQMHLQVPAETFVSQFNWAQYIAAPVLAPAVNSPLLMGRELWMETRIALFRQSLDMRTANNCLREKQARVFFGNDWLKGTAADLFKDHISRFPLLLTREVEENSLEALAAGKAPSLRALRIHNGTVYSWNRPCYGRTNGKPHLRIENRYLPSGPSTLDEIANFAFWVGLMNNPPENVEDLPNRIPFREAKANFYRVARYGLNTIVDWFGQPYPLPELILTKLLPKAKEGLQKAGFPQNHIEQYLDVIKNRVESRQTGACWQIRNFRNFRKQYGVGAALSLLTEAMYNRQQSGAPVHAWPDAVIRPAFLREMTRRPIGAIMQTDLFTVEEEEPIALVRSIMKWKNIRHLPIEDRSGKLTGLITSKDLAKIPIMEHEEDQPVRDFMVRDLITVPRSFILEEAVQLMEEKKIGCLPVVRDGQLTGLITRTDLKRFQLIADA